MMILYETKEYAKPSEYLKNRRILTGSVSQSLDFKQMMWRRGISTWIQTKTSTWFYASDFQHLTNGSGAILFLLSCTALNCLSTYHKLWMQSGLSGESKYGNTRLLDFSKWHKNSARKKQVLLQASKPKIKSGCFNYPFVTLTLTFELSGELNAWYFQVLRWWELTRISFWLRNPIILSYVTLIQAITIKSTGTKVNVAIKADSLL